MMGGKSRPPKPPDYVGAAEAQAEASRDNIALQNYANRPDQYTPWGSETWQANQVYDPATQQYVTQWAQTTSLTPELQQALNSQIGVQQGRSDLAFGFMDRVAQEYAQPFNWSNMPSMYSYQAPGALSTQMPQYSGAINPNVQGQGVTYGFNIDGPQTGVPSLAGQVQTGVNGQPVQRFFSTYDNPSLPAFDSSYRDKIATDLVGRMLPVHQMQQSGLETQLANQGFERGSEAYKRALDDMSARQAGERYNALDIAGNEAQRLYNMQMGQRQQAFNEDVSSGQFFNQAGNQAFQQGLAQGQFGNSAIGQMYNQLLGAGNFANSAQNQMYNQQMGLADLYNRAAAQQFGQDLSAAQFGNQAYGQMAALDLARLNQYNQTMQQQFGMDTQYANQMNQLRQQAITEEMMRRGMSLNEMNALLSGQQVSMPTMPGFVNSGLAETPQILAATGMGYDAALGAYNAQQAASSSMLGGLTNLASTAFMFSDARLKSNVKRLFTHPAGFGIYEYEIFGKPEIGVLAQEVAAIRPDAVALHESGFLMVNYGAL